MRFHWSHGPSYLFYRAGVLIDRWTYDQPLTPAEALAWHNRYLPRLQADRAERDPPPA